MHHFASPRARAKNRIVVTRKNKTMTLSCSLAIQHRNFLRNCSSQEFLEQWSTVFDNIKSSFDDTKGTRNTLNLSIHVKASCVLLYDFLTIASKFPAISKQISLEKGPQLLSQIMKFEFYDIHILIALKSLLKFYPATCSRQKISIVSFLFQLSDTNCQTLKLHASQCVSYLPLVGPAGEQRLKHADNWNNLFNFVLVTLHDVLHEITAALDQSKRHCEFILKSDSIKDDPSLRYKFNQLQSTDTGDLKNRFEFCCLVLVALLDCNLPSVRLPVLPIIQCLGCLAGALRHHRNLRSDVTKCLLNGLPYFCQVFSRITEIMKLRLIPYCPEILFSFESIFHQCTQMSCVSNDDIALAKCGLYDAARQISTYIGSSSKINGLIWKLWTQIKLDLQFQKEDAPKMDNVIENHALSREKKKKRKKSKISNEAENMDVDFGDQFIRKSADYDSKCRLILSVCKFLCAAVEKSCCNFKPSLHRDLQQVVCKLLLDVIHPKGPNSPNQNAYDFNPACKQSLLELLLTLVTSRHPNCPPAILCAVQLFTDYRRKSSDSQVFKICTTALTILDNITKPKVPSLENRLELDEHYSNQQLILGTNKEEDGEQIMNTLRTIMNTSKEKDVSERIDHNGKENLAQQEAEVSQEPIVINIGDEDSPSPPSVNHKSNIIDSNNRPPHDDQDDDCEEIYVAPALKKMKLGEIPVKSKIHYVSANDTSSEMKNVPNDDSVVPPIVNQSMCIATNDKVIELSHVDDLIADFVDAPIDNIF